MNGARSTRHKPRRAAGACAPAAILLAGVLLLFRHSLFSTVIGIPWDLRGYHMPLAAFFARSIAEGRFPLWDPYTYCGFPFFANIAAQPFYPPAWAVALLAGAFGGRMVDWLEWEVAAHVFLAGMFAYALVRRLGCSRPAALLGALVFELGGYFASQAQHVGAVCAAAWLPAAWLAMYALRDGVTARRTGLLAAALSMAFLAGFPQVFLVAAVTTAVLALALVALRQARWTLLAGVAVAGVWTALMSAVQLGPTIQLTGLSVASMRGLWYARPGGVPWQALVSLVRPDYYHLFDLSRYKLPWNPTFLYLYMSIPGLLLAGAAVALRRGREWAPAAAVAVVSFLWMMGQHTPVWTAIHSLTSQILRGALYAEFATCGFLLAMAVLAALGAEWLVTSRSREACWALAVLASADLILAGAGRPMNTMQFPGQDSIATATDFEGRREIADGMRKLTEGYNPPARFDVAGDTHAWSSAAPVMRLYSANGNEPLALKRILDVRLLFSKREPWIRYAEVSDPGSRILDMLNVRYLVSWEHRIPPAIAAAGMAKAAYLPGHDVWENPDALPRFYLVRRTRVARGAEEALVLLSRPGFDPRREAVVEGAVARQFDGGGEAPPVRVLEYGPHRMRLETVCDGPALLVSSEASYPGWHASVDGRRRDLLMVNGAFRGLELTAGAHEVRMWFSPGLLWACAAVSLAAWAAFLVTARTGGRTSPPGVPGSPAA